MHFSKNLFPKGRRIHLLLYLTVTFFLISSCKSDTSETQTETKTENTVDINEPTNKAHDEILAQERSWASALVANDLSTVATMMHRDFRLSRAYGDAPPISKEMYLGMKGMSAASADVTSVKISEEMDSIVVARVTWTMDWEQEGVGKLPPHFDMIDTWKKNKEGTWQILSRVSQIANKPYSDK